MTAQLDQLSSSAVPTGSDWASRLVSPLALIVLGSLALGVIVVFQTWPGLDLMTAALFHDHETHFVATDLAVQVRRVLYIMPWILLISTFGLSLANGSRLIRVWAPCGRGLALLTLSLALGPGLLVNAVLKDHVHRPRPNQITEFGGPLPFRPVGSIEGGCARNCSFVSGEVSVAAWTVSVALLVPIWLQPVAIAAALMLTGAVALWRMGVGAHFLSDTLLAMLFTWIVVIITWWAVFGSRGASRPATGSHWTQAAL